MEKGSSSSAAAVPDSIKFAKKIYCGEAPPRSPAKKGRPMAEPPRCQVEGCWVDLSDSKAYYCRHKVCGLHSKSPMVIVAGLHQRFCQQCSRFHELLEFDQGKRSCRRRLAGHNERRRKPPPSPLLWPRYAGLSPSLSGVGGQLSTCSARDMRRSGLLLDHATTSFQLPWPQAAASPPSIGEDSDSALSLLSNEPWAWGSRSQASDLRVHNTNSAGGVDNSGALFIRYCPLWEYKGDESGHSLPYDMGGSPQTSHLTPHT